MECIRRVINCRLVWRETSIVTMRAEANVAWTGGRGVTKLELENRGETKRRRPSPYSAAREVQPGGNRADSRGAHTE